MYKIFHFLLVPLNFPLYLGHRLDAEVIKRVRVQSWMDCITTCILHKNISCRSVNYRKTGCDTKENCELLQSTHSEASSGSLKKNESFDHYILLNPVIVSTRRKCLYA